MNSLFLYSCIMLFGTFVSAISQVLLKKAALVHHDSRLAEYLNFKVILAYVLFLLASLMCVFAYRVVPLSFGPVLESTSYIYVTVFGIIFFKERITKQKLLALALIIIGIAVFAISG